jgi:hypothetical protein
LTALRSNGGRVVSVIGTGPRIASTNPVEVRLAADATSSASTAAALRGVMTPSPARRGLGDLHRALLEVGLERDRVGRVEGDLVDQLARIEPGTNTSPRGGLLRPRVSTRVRMVPRRDAISTSVPRRTPSAVASSGCM